MQAVNMSVAAKVRISRFVAFRSLGFRRRAKQMRKFPLKAAIVIINMTPDSMTTRYFGLEASSLKYLGASHQYVSYKSVAVVGQIVELSVMVD